LEGCFLSSTEYEDFDYSSSEQMSITMTIRYDNATQSGGLMPTTVQLLTGTMIG
jgi:hypothetical protein